VSLATYRLQLSREFGFDAARRRLPYLLRLGVDTVYLSPILAARAGSPHGYDTVDPGRIDRERGGAAGFRRLVSAARRLGMRLLVDIVPNHVAASPENPCWRDVLERGPGSRFAALFDIDWRRSPGPRPQLLVPWLDGPVGEAFLLGDLAFARARGGTLRLRVRGVPLPASDRATKRFDRWCRRESRHRREALAARARRELAAINRGATPSHLELRDRLLSDLWFRPVPWRDAATVNYRRFADISDLVGVRTETARGFEYVHRGLLRVVARGDVDGFRIDHLDGLADPAEYLTRLQTAVKRRKPERTARDPFYLVVEKVLARDEELPRNWPVDGTSGYDALARITGVLVPQAAEDGLEKGYSNCCGAEARSFREEAYRARREVASTLLAGDRAEVARRMRTCDPVAADGVPDDRIEADLGSVSAGLSVYRTYSRHLPGRPEDIARVQRAVREARHWEPRSLRGRSSALVLQQLPSGLRDAARPPAGRPEVLTRWQQWTAAVAAKGIEDTAFYRHVRFLGSNEVGADPSRIGCGLREFHAFARARARHWSHSLTATSTHDSKWGEDARARFVALAELARPWERSVRRWMRGRRASVPPSAPADSPTLREEYRLYQAWAATAPARRPFDGEYLRRLEEHTVKAAREAKLTTSWMRPNLDHEDGLRDFVQRRARERRSRGFRQEFGRWVGDLAYFGGYYSLAQVVLRTTLPGVADLYQGSEGWNLSLVDPDNRRPVPFDRLERVLSALARPVGPRRLFEQLRSPGSSGPSEALKLLVTHRLLRFRAEHRGLFDEGGYRALYERPPHRPEPVLAFLRQRGSEQMVVVVGRGLVQISGGRRVPPAGDRWGRRALSLPSVPARNWVDVITGNPTSAEPRGSSSRLRISSLFRELPVAVLLGS
jgi:(1->4)-alpha-D-glucan 1-alpha-D-glucosylmutase